MSFKSELADAFRESLAELGGSWWIYPATTGRRFLALQGQAKLSDEIVLEGSVEKSAFTIEALLSDLGRLPVAGETLGQASTGKTFRITAVATADEDPVVELTVSEV